jgi:hypothetical protein
MLPKNHRGIAFLFSRDFSNALQVPAERIAIDYGITKEAAIEEVRRFLAIKVFAVDEIAIEISPTALSTFTRPNTPLLLSTDIQKEWMNFGTLSFLILNSMRICNTLWDFLFTIDHQGPAIRSLKLVPIA